jgi:hypothetical protein
MQREVFGTPTNQRAWPGTRRATSGLRTANIGPAGRSDIKPITQRFKLYRAALLYGQELKTVRLRRALPFARSAAVARLNSKLGQCWFDSGWANHLHVGEVSAGFY